MFSLRVPNARIEELAAAWASTGTWVEGFGGMRLSVALDATADARPVGRRDISELARDGEVELAMFLADPTDSPDHPVFRQLVA